MCCSDFVEITNNNDKTLYNIFKNNNNIDFLEINDETDEKIKNDIYKPSLEAYLSCSTYIPTNYNETPFTRIIYINDEEDLYYRTFLICYVDKKSTTLDSETNSSSSEV